MRWLVLLSFVLAAASSARADEPKHVDVAFHGATAQLTVAFEVRAEDVGRVAADMFAPHNAVVLGGSIRDSAGSHALALVRAEAADRTLEAVSAAAPGRSRATFAQVSQPDGEPRVMITILAPRPETYTIELTFEGPTCLENDTRYVGIPDEWEPALAPAQRAHVTTGACDGEGGTTWVGAPSDELARRKPGVARIGATGARFAASSSQAARVDVALAGVLSVIPDDLHTVLLVDTSRSLTDEERATARAVVKSYLEKAPASSVQVIAYARTATALLPDWTTASSAGSIDKKLAALTPRNGSELPEALRAASTWLAKTRGTRRIVILSDARVADRIAKLSSQTLERLLPARTLVHVVGLHLGDGLVRDDTERWADLAAATEGIATSAGGTEVDATLLVRPISVDHLEIRGTGFTPVADTKHACSESLDEGLSCAWWATGPGSDAVTVRGVLWNRKWTKTVALGARHDVHMARQLRFVLDSGNPIAIAAARASRAVGSEWSLAAQWGGTGGYGDIGPGGGTGWGATCDCGPIGTIGHGSGTGTAELPPTWLHDQLVSAVGACTRTGVNAALTVELTRDEVVDVAATITGAGADAKRIESCVTEAVWNTNVTPPRLDDHQTLQLTF